MNNLKKGFMAVDKIEGSLAEIISDSGEVNTVPLLLLPGGVKEGSILMFGEDGSLVLSKEEEEERRKRIKEKLDRLREG